MFPAVALLLAAKRFRKTESAAPGIGDQLAPPSDPQSNSDLEQRLLQGLSGMRQHKMEVILDSFPEGVAATDREGRITYSNRALHALLAENDTPLNGRTMHDCLPLDATPDRDQVESAFNDTSHPIILELQRTENSSEGILRVARYPLQENGGQSTAHLWSVRDITQQKLADEMRHQFVQTVAEELQVPLLSINANAETLSADGGIDIEQQQAICTVIKAESTRLTRFVSDLMSFSRMEAGLLSLDRKETDFTALVQEVVESVRVQMTQKQIEFEMTLCQNIPKLHLDQEKMSTCLHNLLGNAIKYTPQGGRVELHVELADSTVEIHVVDSGIGIPQEDLPKIFDRFFRGGDENAGKVSGTGIGLSYTREVVNMHGGRVTVQSEPNQGTHFITLLPVC